MMETNENFQIKNDGVVIKIRISPNASKNQVIIENGLIKLKVTAQPIENKANKAVIEFLSKYFKIPKTSISILKGNTSKDKTIFIKNSDSLKLNEIREKLFNQNYT